MNYLYTNKLCFICLQIKHRCIDHDYAKKKNPLCAQLAR